MNVGPDAVRASRSMGLSYVAIACSIEALESVYSSRDEALFAQIVQGATPAVRHYLALDRSDADGSDGVPDHLRPLYDLFVGAACTRCDPRRYAAALIACALSLGTPLGESHGSYGRHSAALGVLGVLGADDDLLPDVGTTWPVPGLRDVDDWPMYVGIPADEVARRAVALRSLRPALAAPHGDATERDRAHEFILECADFYEACAALRLDLIVVAH